MDFLIYLRSWVLFHFWDWHDSCLSQKDMVVDIRETLYLWGETGTQSFPVNRWKSDSCHCQCLFHPEADTHFTEICKKLCSAFINICLHCTVFSSSQPGRDVGKHPMWMLWFSPFGVREWWKCRFSLAVLPPCHLPKQSYSCLNYKMKSREAEGRDCSCT